MQLVPRQTLMQLMRKPEGIEEVERSFSYNDLLQLTDELMKMNKSEEDPVWETYNDISKSWLKENCPPLKYLGEGSTRIAYGINGGKCLKLATCDEGIDQMQNEIFNFTEGQDYACFPKLYAYDKDYEFSLVTDCCCEAKPDDFKNIYGIPCNLIVGTLEQLRQDNMNPTATEKYFNECIADPELGSNDEYENFKPRLQFLKKLVQSKKTDMRWTSLWDLALYCSGNSKLGLYDLESEVNWGMTPRYGELCPVVIDAGLTQQGLDY